MVEPSDESVRNFKFILFCFECLSGLKMNYHKSEVFVFGAEDVLTPKFGRFLRKVRKRKKNNGFMLHGALLKKIIRRQRKFSLNTW